jgi:hypothetical protein
LKLQINVKDRNEYPPIISASMPIVTITETSSLTPEADLSTFTVFPMEFYIDCNDRDMNASLSLRLGSVGYVNELDTNNFIDERLWQHANPDSLKELFLMRVSEEFDELDEEESNSTSSTQIGNVKRANLFYNSAKLDFERLYRMKENYIRIDLICTDGLYESSARVLLKVENVNDNAPLFPQKLVTIERNETSLPETVYTAKAVDLDGTDEKLVYSIDHCEPDGAHAINIDQNTGEVRSDLRLTVTTEELLNGKYRFYSETGHLEHIKCQIRVSDRSNFTDTMTLTIEINNINNSPPQIVDSDDHSNEIVIEVSEGEDTRDMILKSIHVFDADGAQHLQCVFSDGYTRQDPFELRTVPEKDDPNSVRCVLKVVDSMYIDYDTTRRSSYLLEMKVLDKEPKPVYPNAGETVKKIRVNVKAVNNKPPKFVNGDEETFYILDSNKPGTLIGTVLATDVENTNPDSIVYKIESIVDKMSMKKKANLIGDKFELRKIVNSTNAYWGSVGLYTREVRKLNS